MNQTTSTTMFSFKNWPVNVFQYRKFEILPNNLYIDVWTLLSEGSYSPMYVWLPKFESVTFRISQRIPTAQYGVKHKLLRTSIYTERRPDQSGEIKSRLEQKKDQGSGKVESWVSGCHENAVFIISTTAAEYKSVELSGNGSYLFVVFLQFLDVLCSKTKV